MMTIPNGGILAMGILAIRIQILFRTTDEGLYDVTLAIENFNGCTDSITKQILVLPFLTVNIPNSFTPNDDQVNDLFEVLGNGILNYDIKYSTAG